MSDNKNDELKLDVHYHRKNLEKLTDELESYTTDEYRRFLNVLIKVSRPVNERYIPQHPQVEDALKHIEKAINTLKVDLDYTETIDKSEVIQNLLDIKAILGGEI